jgi:hypothetical protein
MNDSIETKTRSRQSKAALQGLAVLLLVFTTSGATCQQWMRQYSQPRTLPQSATLDQVMSAVNDNTARVQSAQAAQATLSIPGVPALRTNVAFQSPQRFRLRADGPLGGGPELDLGSNDELFWLWVRRNQPPAMFFCRQELYGMSAARQIIPIEPQWLIEAAGLVRFDPMQPHEGPKPVGNGRIEIKSRRPSPAGDLTQVVVVDEWDGTVAEQHLYDASAQRIATARTSHYKRDAVSGAALPKLIEVEWPTAQMSFRLEVTDWQVNAIPADNLTIWSKPVYPGYPDVDLADPNLRFNVGASGVGNSAPLGPAPPSPTAQSGAATGQLGALAAPQRHTVVYPEAPLSRQ